MCDYYSCGKDYRLLTMQGRVSMVMYYNYFANKNNSL